jgi:methionyl aminopeptidase
MSIITDPQEVADLKEAGKRHAHILDALEKAVAPGVTTGELDALAEKMVRDYGDEPAFKGYQPEGSHFPYPASVCISVNDEIVHGIPGDYALQEGDIVGLDFGVKHKGLITDAAITVAVGTIAPEVQDMMNITKRALYAGIDAAVVGNRVGDISAAIEKTILSAPRKYGIMRELGGHGVGRKVHEEPFVPNYGQTGTGPVLKEGQVLALEPMTSLGDEAISLDDDGYTIRTMDNSMSAHYEHTIMITKDGPVVITETGV